MLKKIKKIIFNSSKCPQFINSPISKPITYTKTVFNSFEFFFVDFIHKIYKLHVDFVESLFLLFILVLVVFFRYWSGHDRYILFNVNVLCNNVWVEFFNVTETENERRTNCCFKFFVSDDGNKNIISMCVCVCVWICKCKLYTSIYGNGWMVTGYCYTNWIQQHQY